MTGGTEPHREAAVTAKKEEQRGGIVPSLSIDDLSEEFAQGRTRALAVVDATQRYNDQKAEIEERLASVRGALSTLSAETLANGGVAGMEINGTNKEKRDAQLQLAIERSPNYTALMREIRDGTRALSEIESRLITARQHFSIATREMDFAIERTAWFRAMEKGLK